MGLVHFSEGLATSASRLPRSTEAINMGSVAVGDDGLGSSCVARPLNLY